ncbi:MAG TPA: gamma carbonic anhydrase family protein [Myxococcales bacterium]|nr:gamma carbonic anhydrase family protein [Myxococcales bacterium]
MIQTYKGKRPQIDPSAFVHPMATVIGEVVLGPRVSIWPGVVLRGDCGLIDIGADSNIQDGTVVHTTGGWSRTVIGKRVTVGHNVVLHGCQVADDCLIGMGSVLLDNSLFGRHTMVAAGSVVPPGKEFLDGGLIIGNPAQFKRPLGDHHREMIELGWRAYIEYSSAFIQGEVETIG